KWFPIPQSDELPEGILDA
ncbi:hypothetical protein, partial [Cronobacter sakazakii]